MVLLYCLFLPEQQTAHLRVMRVQNTSCHLHAETGKCQEFIGCQSKFVLWTTTRNTNRRRNFHISTLRTTKLPMNLRHCTQPLNTHQLTTADAQHEAATDITRGMGIVAVVERGSESLVRAICGNDVHISVRSNQKHKRIPTAQRPQAKTNQQTFARQSAA